MTVEIISRSIFTKILDQAKIELATPGSAVRHPSVARHLTDCYAAWRNLVWLGVLDFSQNLDFLKAVESLVRLFGDIVLSEPSNRGVEVAKFYACPGTSK